MTIPKMAVKMKETRNRRVRNGIRNKMKRRRRRKSEGRRKNQPKRKSEKNPDTPS